MISRKKYTSSGNWLGVKSMLLLIFIVIFASFLWICYLVRMMDIKGLVADSRHFYKAGAAYKAEDYGDAEMHYKAITKNRRKYWQIQYAIGHAYYKQGRYQEAADIFGSILKDSGKAKATILNDLGNSYFRLGDLNQSLKAYQNALLTDSENIPTKENIMLVWYMLRALNQPPSAVKQKKPQETEDHPGDTQKSAAELAKKKNAQKGNEQHSISNKEMNELLDMIRKNEIQKSKNASNYFHKDSVSNGPDY